MPPRRTRADWQIEATETQMKAVASATRLRILRLCNDREWTNKELAERLDLDPSTVHRHVRLLVDAGLLEATGVRQGASGAYEKPYRSTGLSWKLTIDEVVRDEDGAAGTVDASHEPVLLTAFRQELTEAGNDSIAELSRFHLHLDEDALDAFLDDFKSLVNRYAGGVDVRPGTRAGVGPGYGGLFVVHRLPDDDPPQPGAG